MSAEHIITEHLDLWTGAVTHKSGAGRGRSGKSGKIELTGIKKLRELILELAVRGKLVEQNPNDEPASVLLDKIAEEKTRLVKEGKIKKQKKLPEIAEKEAATKIPTTWSWSRLGEITNYGVTDKVEPRKMEATTWVLELEDIEKESSRLVQQLTYRERPFKSSKNRFQRCDVLYGKLRPYLDKVFVADRPGVCTTEIIPMRGFSGITSQYLRLSLKSPAFKTYANNSTHGMSLPRLGTDKARLALIPVPPTKEQHRIVEKVDELMALCDRLEQQVGDQLEAHDVLVDTLLDALTRSSDAAETAEHWARIAEHFDMLFTTEASIDKLKQAVLQLAVMGKLVPQDPNDEPASVLLEKISEEKAKLVKEGKIKKSKKTPDIENNECSYLIHKNWIWSRFQDIATEISTGPFGSMIHKYDYVDDGVPLINPSHMVGGKIQENRSVSITPKKAEELSNYKLESDDIVMARRGEVGRCAIVTYREAGWLCGTGSFVLRFHKKLSRRFILIMFATNGVRRYLTGNSIGTTMTNLNHGILNRIPIAFPPINEQHRIVAKVDELMTLCDRLKARLGKAGETRAHLAEAVVKRAVS